MQCDKECMWDCEGVTEEYEVPVLRQFSQWCDNMSFCSFLDHAKGQDTHFVSEPVARRLAKVVNEDN